MRYYIKITSDLGHQGLQDVLTHMAGLTPWITEPIVLFTEQAAEDIISLIENTEVPLNQADIKLATCDSVTNDTVEQDNVIPFQPSACQLDGG